MSENKIAIEARELAKEYAGHNAIYTEELMNLRLCLEKSADEIARLQIQLDTEHRLLAKSGFSIKWNKNPAIACLTKETK